MGQRKLADDVEKQPYFEAVSEEVSQPEEGTRDMGVQYPFLICGGKNTERYYFLHISNTTNYKFNIRPKYFGDESSYTETFPNRINEILRVNNDAKIFCVFDWDTVFGNETRLNKHKTFENRFSTEIDNGTVVICRSMPCVEYWFLLHFEYNIKFYKNYGAVSGKLAPYLKPCFVDSSIPLKKLLKKETNLKDATWVKKLCENGKLDLAIERAKNSIEEAMASGELDNRSYSYIYKVFEP